MSLRSPFLSFSSFYDCFAAEKKPAAFQQASDQRFWERHEVWAVKRERDRRVGEKKKGEAR